MGADANVSRRLKEFLRGEFVRTFRHDHWNIGIADVPIRAFLEREARPDIRWLPPPPRGKYHSDPFGLTRDGITAIFFEEYDFRSNKGVISCVREEAKHLFSRPTVVINLPFHASYPFLIEHAGSVYCVPETGDGREIALYRAKDFPLQWKKEVTLVEGVRALDSSIFEWDGMFWLFCTDEDDGPFSKLRVWFAPKLHGPWKAHPGNPVVTDVQSARPAGTPFEVGGELYRPGQDCSRTYGGAITVSRVARLSTTDYREERAATVGPLRAGPYSKGMHTLSSFGGRTLIDAKWKAFNIWEMSRNLRESLADRWARIVGRP